MATILPQEFADKTKSELYQDIVALSHYVTKLRHQLEDEQAQTKLSKAREIKLRGDILKLKSMIGHQNIHITDLVKQIEQIDNIEDITYEEAN